MSLSIKVSQLDVLQQITHDDYIIVNDSGSVTTKRATFDTLGDYLSGSNKPVGSASFAISASHANVADLANVASQAVSASYSLSSSYVVSSSYSLTSSYASFAASAANVGPSSSYASASSTATFASIALSASYASSSTFSNSSTFSVSSSYASASTTSSYTTTADNINYNASIPRTGLFYNPYYQYVAIWSGSYTGKLDRTGIMDLGFQYNVGKPFTFTILDDSRIGDVSSLNKFTQPFIEFRQGLGAYNPWLITSYVYTSGSSKDFTGSWVGANDPSQLPPGTPYTRNLRFIPTPAGPGQSNFLDETGIGSQQWTLYFRSQKNFTWYQYGSFLGHRDAELDPGISGSCIMTLSGARLGVGNFSSQSAVVGYYQYPQAPLHVSASENALTNGSIPLLRLDQKVNAAGGIGTLQGYITVNINGVNYKLALFL